jgi:3-deoxy-D-arabino-heptulosonate 7-phosphate (DAHP) synthase class II
MRPHIREPVGQETVPMATSHELTLLDVIQAVSEVAENDQEIVATVTHLICSGQVRLRNDAIEAIRQLVATVDAAA